MRLIATITSTLEIKVKALAVDFSACFALFDVAIGIVYQERRDRLSSA